MIGFLPGFPYMAEVDPLLMLPRKATPQGRVEAGSVGIAGVQTGIYPVASPGGWQIVGRTPLRLFNPESDPPVVLEPGDQVRFYDITSGEFRKMNQHNA
jgi:inhibitor of KinA